MASASSQEDESFTCPVCLELLRDPVAIPCGHNFCMRCIKGCWDQEDWKGKYSCPLCKLTFSARPVLYKNPLIAEVVEKFRKTRIQAAPACGYAGPGDMECDVCTGRKLKAVKSCLDCLMLYCDTHLKTHNELLGGKHTVINAIGQPQERICSRHKKVFEIFCRTDQSCICCLCLMGDHKGHDTVTAAAEWGNKKEGLGQSQRRCQQRIQLKEKELQELRKAVENLKSSAQTALEESERTFTEICSIERMHSEVKGLIRAQEKAEVRRAEGLLERLEQEIAELKRRDAEMEQLSLSEDPIHFLKNIVSITDDPFSTVWTRRTFSQSFFEPVNGSLSALKMQLERTLDSIFKQEIAKISAAVTNAQIIPDIKCPGTDPELPVRRVHSKEHLPPRMSDGQALFTEPVMREDFLQCLRYERHMRTEADVGMSEYRDVLLTETRKGPLDTNRFTPLSGNPRGPGNPPVYLLNMKSATAGEFNKKVFGKSSSRNPSNRTIMLVGATGSGKTTLINGMVNYILGVEWEDNWRFKLIDEETNKSQAHSQTSEVTAYQIHRTDEFPDEVPYSLTIIDTPGFGDTRGIKHDREITDKIRDFFTNKKGTDTIDAVCFVVQAALAHLTHTQKYIFEAILPMFGKNIANNIITLVTFADGQRPPVLEAIKAANIPCAQTDGSPALFKFNNSALFADNTGGSSDEGNFDYMFWRMGKASIAKFFTHLGTMETQSLTLTKQVLQERKHLKTTIEGVQPLIQKGLSTMEVIRTTQAALDKHKTKIRENKDFEYELEVYKSEKIDIPAGTCIMNCHGCNYTCHYPCSKPNDADKRGCSAMRDGYCTVCPGKCIWSVHHNMTYRWDIKRVTEKRTYQELKSKYDKAMGEKMRIDKILTQLQVEYYQVQGKVAEMMETVTECLRRLKEIALRPDPLATPDYIDLLIQSEEQKARPGFKQRIKELQEVRERAVLMQKVAQGIVLNESAVQKMSKMSKFKAEFWNWFS
ncbi:hypothetical protein ACEWY4_005101 [Coilia grayii]|uniref:Uncharacterized protein n=1 Tax=Coilia grayii TaxID=363190 RepID=A0ABD1KHC8_9TELE